MRNTKRKETIVNIWKNWAHKFMGYISITKGEKLKLKLIHVILNKYDIDVLLDNNIYEYLCEIKDKSCEYAFPREESQYLHYKAARTKRLIYYTLSFNPERKTIEMLSEAYENSESDHERYKYDCVLNVYH